MVRWYCILLKTSYTAQLQQITLPILIAFGKYDLVISPDLGDTLYQRLGSTDKKLVILARSGHAPMLNEPELLNPEVLAFVQAHR